MLKTTHEKIDQSLKIFLDKIKHDYCMHLVHPVLFESIREFILRDGKRLRPALLVFSYKGYCPAHRRISPSIHYVSTCIELLHAFMLVHDDIIDRSNLRRGKPTLHKLLARAVKTADKERLGYDLAIVAGDIIYALAIDAFLSVREDPGRKEEALKYFIQTAVFTAMGEFIDTVHGVDKIGNIREKDVLLNYTLKTARYTFDCPLVVGAILAGAGQNDIRLLSRFGLLMGQAFQIQDDIIGVFGSQKNIGKSVLSDFAESKKTILVCHAFRHLSGTNKKKFLRLFNKNKKTYADLTAVRKIFIEAGSLPYSLTEINKRLTMAREILGRVTMKPPYRRMIEDTLFQLFRASQDIADRFRTGIVIQSSAAVSTQPSPRPATRSHIR